MSNNPFNLTFGKEPQNIIEREREINEIFNNFMEESPSYQACIITGVRGSGKTVALTNIANKIKKEKDWIVINLNPERDLLNTLAAELTSKNELIEMFKDAKINLSILGFGIEIDGVAPITDITIALRKMLEKLTKQNKKVLVAIDEASKTKEFKQFISQFQIYVRENLNIYLIMTGLYKNINLIQNDKTLTFLYRSPKFNLNPLNALLVSDSYHELLKISEDDAKEMSGFTKGYAFAYQLLGYLCYKNNKHYKNVIKEFDSYIAEYSYDKIWSECTEKEKELLKYINETPTKVESIITNSNIKYNVFSQYRDALIKKGLIEGNSFGFVSLSLPRFKEYIENK